MAKSKYSGFKAKDILEAQKSSRPQNQTSTFWKPGLEKDQSVAEYMIRFLPNKGSFTGVNYVQRNQHMIKFPNGNYISESCPSCIVKKWDCPICQEVKPWFKSGNQRLENLAKKYYAKPRYFSNIYVVTDPRDDRINEGKIFVFEYGIKIHNKCQQILQGDEEENEDGVVHFDFLSGATFKVVVNKVTGDDGQSLPNYDDSRFIKKNKPLILVSTGEEISEDEIDNFMDGAYDLNEMILADKHFKSFDDLKLLYENRGSSSPFDESDSPKTPVSSPVTEKEEKKVVVEKVVNEKPKVDDDDDDDLKKLLAEDD